MKRIVLILIFFLMSCRGDYSEQPPVHLNPNMDKMPRYKSQSASEFFTDGSAMRIPSEGTVAESWLRDDNAYNMGIDKNGELIQRSPVLLTAEVLKRGRQRFDIYCSPCHGRTGAGNGIVVQRGFIPPPDFHTNVMRQNPDGHFFSVISNGIRNMPTYRHQVPVTDRWAITAYIRALQRSQFASVKDIPIELRK
jgi:mono/diheme cytochrome c family protein